MLKPPLQSNAAHNEILFLSRMGTMAMSLFCRLQTDSSRMFDAGSPSLTSPAKPDHTIMLLDRSSLALANLEKMIGIIDERNRSDLIPKSVRTWLHDPVQGHYLAWAVNPNGGHSSCTIDDDLEVLLEGVQGMMRGLMGRARGNGCAVWRPVLCEATKHAFIGWLQTKRI